MADYLATLLGTRITGTLPNEDPVIEPVRPQRLRVSHAELQWAPASTATVGTGIGGLNQWIKLDFSCTSAKALPCSSFIRSSGSRQYSHDLREEILPAGFDGGDKQQWEGFVAMIVTDKSFRLPAALWKWPTQVTNATRAFEFSAALWIRSEVVDQS